MNTKNLDAIKRMVVRLQSIRETEFLYLPTFLEIGEAMEILKKVVATYDAYPATQDTEEVRAD